MEDISKDYDLVKWAMTQAERSAYAFCMAHGDIKEADEIINAVALQIRFGTHNEILPHKTKGPF